MPTMAVLLDAVLLLLGQCLRGVEVGVSLDQGLVSKTKETQLLSPSHPYPQWGLGSDKLARVYASAKTKTNFVSITDYLI